MKTQSEEINGILAKVRFAQDGYMIGSLDVGNGNGNGHGSLSPIPIKGPMLRPELGLEYVLVGTWDDNPRWGRQFKFTDYRSKLPSSTDAIRDYLAEHCRWVGRTIATRMIDAFGKDTLTVLKTEPERVAKEISGITSERAMEIAAKLRAIEREEALDLALRDVLANTRIPKRAVHKIKEKWGDHAVEKIKINPFELIEEIDGVGFHTADQIAKRVGYDHRGAPRIDAGIKYTLEDAAGSGGHVCLPKSDLHTKAAAILDLEESLVIDRVVVLIGTGDVIEAGDFIYLRSLYEAETSVAKKLKTILGFSGNRIAGKVNTDGLMDDQKEAIEQAVKNGVFLLTGAPGTGKTFTVKKIIDSFPNARIALAAPTGKAAKRMSEQTGRDAITIHRLLGARPSDSGEFEFEQDERQPIPADLIVLDEVSMVDIRLMASFMRAVSPSTRLIFVGDFNQLPSVGPGNVLRHLIDSGVIPNVELTIIKRQEPGLIVLNCHAIKNGKDVLVNNGSRDFFFLSREDTDGIRQTIRELVSERVPKSYKLDPVKDVQVITALREKTTISCKTLNEDLQAKLNKNPNIGNTKFKLCDKVIQLRNTAVSDARTGMPITIANGDIGYIQEVRNDGKSFVVEFESPARTVEIPARDNDLDLAYALTVHKFQGSEAKVVIIPIHKSAGFMILQRNWLYTAISRAREVCILVGQRGEVPQIISRKTQQVRYSRLVEYLKSSEEEKRGEGSTTVSTNRD